MWKSFMDRVSEPSTFAGLAALSYGLGQVADIKEAPAVADALSGVGQSVAGGADPITAGLVGLFGLISVFMKEKGGK